MATHLTGRHLKDSVRRILAGQDFAEALNQLDAHPPRRVVNPLFTFMLAGENRLRWRAITAMGHVIAKLYQHEQESARVIMRRLMWSLNDESGGIGWGAPEAMGDAMARSAALADEYGRILISYADPRGNYLEHPTLQEGLAWALGRLGRSRPTLTRTAAPHLPAFLTAAHPILRGRAAWAAGPIIAVLPEKQRTAFIQPLTELTEDTASVEIYNADEFTRYTVGELARMALADGA